MRLKALLLTFCLFTFFLNTEAQQIELFGTTSRGGQFDKGTIFKYDLQLDSLITLHDAEYATGEILVSGITQAKNGRYYGMSTTGGNLDRGVIYEYNPITNIYSQLYGFSDSVSRQNKGHFYISDSLIIYGIIEYDSSIYDGALFSYNTKSNVYQPILNFKDSIGGKTIIGGRPILKHNTLYAAFKENNFGNGVLCSFDLSTNAYLNLAVRFDSVTNFKPNGEILFGNDGNIYGIAAANFPNDLGRIFRYNFQTSQLETLHQFLPISGAPSNPNGGLTEITNGVFWGMSHNGGNNGYGTIFEYNANLDTFRIIHHIDNSYLGKSPNGTLMKASNGLVYGTVTFGGAPTNEGVLFKIDPANDSVTKILQFNLQNGRYPFYLTLSERNYCYDLNLDIIQQSDTLVSLDNNGIYQWYDCNSQQLISGETRKAFKPQSNGNYAVILTKNNCSDTSKCVAFTLTNTQKNNELSTIVIYPNPTKGIVTIHFDNLIESSISIYSVDGTLLHSEIDSYKLEKDIDFPYPSGVYVLEIRLNNGEIIRKKVIKE